MSKETIAKGVLAVVWLAIQLVLFYQHGVKIVYDSHRFIRFTTQLVLNQPITDPHVWRYVGYPLFMFPFFKTGQSLHYIVLAQMAISGFAAIALYKTSIILTEKTWLALFCTALFILNPDLQAWNCYILTDSLLISLTPICICLALMRKTKPVLLGLLAATVRAVLVRPNGFIIPLAVGLFYTFKYNPFAYYNKWVVSSIGVIILLMFYLVLDHFLLSTFGIMHTYERGDIIFGYYDILLNKFYQPKMPSSSLTRLGELLWFITRNPVYFIAVASLKGLFFFLHIKPYYSLTHNLFILAFLLPVYAFAWIGWKRGEISPPVRALLLTPVVLQTGITMLTIEDWDGRWLFPILPSIFLFASVGIFSLFKRKHLVSLS